MDAEPPALLFMCWELWLSSAAGLVLMGTQHPTPDSPRAQGTHSDLPSRPHGTHYSLSFTFSSHPDKARQA